MSRICLCMVMALSVVTGLRAEDDYSSFVTLLRSDTSSKQSYSDPGNWSDGLEPHADADYYVPAGRSLYKYHSTDPTTNLWKGGKLVIGGGFTISASSGNSYAPIVPDLTFLEGTKLNVACYGPFYSTGANTTRVTIAATRANPMVMEQYYSQSYTSSNFRRFNEMAAIFLGTADSAFVYNRRLTGCDRGFSLNIRDYTFADYPGLFTIRGSNSIVEHYDNGVISMPKGSLAVEDGAELVLARGSYQEDYAHAAYKGFSVSNAVVKATYVPSTKSAYPVIDASSSFQLQDGARLEISGTSLLTLNGARADEPIAHQVHLAHLTDTAASSVTSDSFADAEFALAGVKLPDFIPAIFDVTSNADGSKDVHASYANLVTMTNENIETTNASGASYGACAPGHAGDWSDGLTPTAESTRHYVAVRRLCCFQNIELPNATLTYAANASMKGGTRIRVKKLAFLSGVSLGLWSGGTVRTFEAEDICLVSNSTAAVKFYPFASATLVLKGPMRGDVPLTLTNNGDQKGTIALPCDNSGLTREVVIVAAPKSKTDSTITPGLMTVVADTDTSLGGPYTGATPWRAVEISDWAQLSVTNDVTLNQANRGVFVNNCAWATVAPNKTLTVGNAVTYAGELRKLGAGTLALGGAARFLDGQEETAPAAGANRLTVAEGALKILSTNACDGLEVAFEPGTKLVLANEVDEDTAAYGLYNVKWATPLVLPADGKLPVAFEAEKVGRRCARAICTVTTEAEAKIGLSVNSFVVTRPAGCKAPKVTRVLDEVAGLVTYRVTVQPSGTTLLLR
ncbi:MAG: hypothetical protein MJ240_10380 [Kiritimatiellae bacterium]|nr:hypothetical protein [Kiritimatiellia bacterium]